MSKARVFTLTDFKLGEMPAGIRGNKKTGIVPLLSFHYFEGHTEYCFAGIDANNKNHFWRGNGRKEGKKNNMYSDLVVIERAPADETIFLAKTFPMGTWLAYSSETQAKQTITRANFELYSQVINTETLQVGELTFLGFFKKLEHENVANQPTSAR